MWGFIKKFVKIKRKGRKKTDHNMNKSKYIIGGIVVIVIVVLAMLLGMNRDIPVDQQAPASEGTTAVEQNQPGGENTAIEGGATGNIDDATATILGDAEGDEPPAAESDPSILEEDNQALDDVGKLDSQIQ